MPAHDVNLGDDKRLRIWWSNWNGRERVEYNGTVVSENRNLTRMVSPHAFTVDENGEPARYDVRFTGYMGHVVRRNGEVVEEKHRPVVRYFLAFGLVYLALMVLSGLAGALLDEGVLPAGLAPWLEDLVLLAALLGAFLLAARFKRRLVAP